MREEVEMLARIRAAVPGGDPVLWGLDYEVGADRRLVALLEAAKKPATAEAALARLKAAQTAAWAKSQSGGIQEAFSFAGDPELVAAVRSAWPKPDARSLWGLDALEETLRINGLWNARKGWESNLRRSQFIRANFVRHWQAEGDRGRAMFKLGANHLIRGLNDVGMFDLGSLLPEVAAQTGGHTFSVMVLPGTTSDVAVLDPQAWSYKPASAKDNYANGLEVLGNLAFPDAFTLFDLRQVRQVIGRRSTAAYPQLARMANGFDALLVMSGSKPSQNL
jgi:hypothetical protein